MSGERQANVDIRPWSESDLSLLERLMGDLAMTVLEQMFDKYDLFGYN